MSNFLMSGHSLGSRFCCRCLVRVGTRHRDSMFTSQDELVCQRQMIRPHSAREQHFIKHVLRFRCRVHAIDQLVGVTTLTGNRSIAMGRSRGRDGCSGMEGCGATRARGGECTNRFQRWLTMQRRLRAGRWHRQRRRSIVGAGVSQRWRD